MQQIFYEGENIVFVSITEHKKEQEAIICAVDKEEYWCQGSPPTSKVWSTRHIYPKDSTCKRWVCIFVGYMQKPKHLVTNKKDISIITQAREIYTTLDERGNLAKIDYLDSNDGGKP
jgi:hypothetical protein